MTRQSLFILSILLSGLSSATAVLAQTDPAPGKLEARSPLTQTAAKISRAYEITPDALLAVGSMISSDCNLNGQPDGFDISTGTSEDCNGNGIPDECELRNRADFAFPVNPPEPILDGFIISRTFNVPESGRVFDVDLGVTLTHQFFGDIVITLTHGTTSVDVYFFGPCDACSTTCGFDGTVFDDEATGPVPCNGLNQGSFFPNNPLSAFDGMDAAGDWTLTIFDGFIGFEGSLTDWSLSIEASTPADCDGNDMLDECETSVGAPIDQWAATVIGYSSQYSDGAFSAEQALGFPDTFVYGDFGSAWAPSNFDGTMEFISVGFDTPVFADGATVRETSGNGFVTRIDLVDTLGGIHTIWEGDDPSLIGTPVEFRIDWARTDYLVTAVTVYTDTDTNLNTWEEIDAIRLHGAPANSIDCNGNAIPDICDLAAGSADCDSNGILDVCDIAVGISSDCNANNILDQCDVAAGSADCNANGVPDDCDIAPLGSMLDQWASEVISFSRQANVLSAIQVLGPPNQSNYGGGGSSWNSPFFDGTLEYITVGYPLPVYATGVSIRETGGNGMVYQVDVLDTNDVLHTVWQGTDPTPTLSNLDFDVDWPVTSYLVKGVKVYTDTNSVLSRLEYIDAIELHGLVGSDCNGNGTDDWCEFGLTDCNANGTPDGCDVLTPVHNCCDANHGPGCSDPDIEACICSDIDPQCCSADWDDSCVQAVKSFGCGSCEIGSPDCNANSIPDECEIAADASSDCNGNNILDQCDVAAGSADCNANGIPDDCDIAPLGSMLDQWAFEVISFSRQANVLSAIQVLGPPNQSNYGGGGSSWGSFLIDGTLEFITVGYPLQVYATGVSIRETGGNGMVYQVDVLDTNDVLHTVWQGTDPTPTLANLDFDVDWPVTSYLVKGVKVYTDTNSVLSRFEYLDAIALHGLAASDCNDNGMDDWCEFGLDDCNANGVPDGCDVLQPNHDCCELSSGVGCSDANIEACVCKMLPDCCINGWDETCAIAVETYSCGSCESDSIDCDANGISDVCELGDFDEDNTVDLADYKAFHNCYTAPGFSVGPGCEVGDFDCDSDIDLRDFAAFQIMLPMR